ncbi:hypothetical protein L1987_07215 [Smallanthus sonchifolius]|uniref:Uncharacterized protein n=1 Tax=Smallanthus sonchifolius TaxID=185202 RepID=A0ACB9K097_9ASTR|nr:hypothetical protein L1987_07215 [Smallanthus sonchifolius]
MLADKPNWSDIIDEKEIFDQQDIVATMKISNVLNELNETFEITKITKKGMFGEDIDIEDGLIGEQTERSEIQQAGEIGAKVSERERKKRMEKKREGLRIWKQQALALALLTKLITTGKYDGKVMGGLEELEALNFSFGFTKETDSVKGCEKKQNEMVSDVHQAPKQTEKSKGAEGEASVDTSTVLAGSFDELAGICLSGAEGEASYAISCKSFV